MRVVWIYKSPWKKPGPIVYMGVLNARATAGCGVETDLFVGGDDDPPETNVEGDLRAFYGVEPHPKLRVHRVDERAGGFSIVPKRPVYEAALRQVKTLLAAGEKVLVVTRELGILPALIRVRPRYPALRIIHEAHDFYGRIDHLPARKLRDYRRWFSERYYLPRCDGLLCITEPQRELYAEVFPRLPNIYLPLGCVEARVGADAETRRRKRRLGYIGHLHDKKGYRLLLEAAEQLRPHGVTLECYGGYPEQVKRFRAEIAARGLAGNILLEPFCGPTEMFSWLAENVSIGVAPLLDIYYNRNLTCPVKVLDYLSQGLPVVGTDLPSVRDLAAGAAEYHQADATAGFVSAVLRVLDDAARYEALSKESRARAQVLAWPNRAAALLEFAGKLR